MITANETVKKMIASLKDQAKSHNVSLNGMTRENFNSFLDDLFDDGGEIRCIYFIDIATDYAIQFGEIESDKFEAKRWAVISRVFDYFEKQNK